MANRIEIRLTQANNKPVSLKSMSPEALDSFMAVMSSLKSIALSISDEESLTFSISEGSALCAIEASKPTMTLIYNGLDDAIKGKSNDKAITSNLRKIQTELIRPNYNYSFTFKSDKKHDIDICKKLINSNRITTKRTIKLFEYKIRIKSGLLNQIGGKEPNYHFDYGNGDKITIVCTREEAMDINKYLYKYVHSLLVCKEWSGPNKKTEYFHKAILDEFQLQIFNTFFNVYYKESDLISKLTLIHDFVEKEFQNSRKGHETLKILLIGFNDKNFHLSEIKTLLIISKPFKEHEIIKDAREALLATYQQIRR